MTKTIELTIESVERIEDVAPRFADLLRYAWHVDAARFAADLAIGGANPEHLRRMAGDWAEFDFDPPELGGALEMLADDVERLAVQHCKFCGNQCLIYLWHQGEPVCVGCWGKTDG